MSLYFGNGYDPACYPSCLNYIPNKQFYGVMSCDIYPTAQSNQEKALCALVAATNIRTYSNYWSCNINERTNSDPCSSIYPWSGITCLNGNIIQLNLNYYALTGNC